ncbi:MAG: hypothetical protein EZS28_013713, partial [Streblomastix strix]
SLCNLKSYKHTYWSLQEIQRVGLTPQSDIKELYRRECHKRGDQEQSQQQIEYQEQLVAEKIQLTKKCYMNRISDTDLIALKLPEASIIPVDIIIIIVLLLFPTLLVVSTIFCISYECCTSCQSPAQRLQRQHEREIENARADDNDNDEANNNNNNDIDNGINNEQGNHVGHLRNRQIVDVNPAQGQGQGFGNDADDGLTPAERMMRDQGWT